MDIGDKLRKERVRQGWRSGPFASESDLTMERLRAIEEGSHYPSASELDRMLFALRKPLAWVDGNDLPLITSRYEQVGTKRPSPIEYVLDQVASDMLHLLDTGVVEGGERPKFDIPTNHDEAGQLANEVRMQAGLDDKKPVEDVSKLCEKFGLWEFAANLDGGATASPGLMVEVASSKNNGSVGIAVIDSSKFQFHQRFVLAHELCHWLIGDEFEGATVRPDEFDIEKRRDEPLRVEEACSSFAAHLLLPDRAMARFRSASYKTSKKDVAVELAKNYGMGWRSTVDLLMSAGQVSLLDAEQLRLDREADEEVISKQYFLDSNRVASGYLAQIRQAVESGRITESEAEGFSYGASPHYTNS